MTPLLELDGELTIAVAAEQQARLRTFLQQGAAAAGIGLSGVTELDTAGLQLLLAARREAAQRGTALTFLSPSRAVRDVFVMAHLALEPDGVPL
ncbi:STAS domain-containing protein [Dactylosporangium sp. NBC_01737]|uniref:STAS domain-containing protein n=1 Tax=Dactylosporangium sp. NBC_01737 TaxID=2975959 RepID=UPI002E132243|nr:STAS domain-containing protein [Dactylosporangium sp. NBC_01737]